MYKKYRLLCLVLTFFLLLRLFPIVNATNDIEPRYSTLQTFAYSFNIDSNGNAKGTASIEARPQYLLKLTVKLQRYQNGSWVLVDSWTSTGSIVVALLIETKVDRGYAYRIVVDGYAFDSNHTLLEQDNGVRSAYY